MKSKAFTRRDAMCGLAAFFTVPIADKIAGAMPIYGWRGKRFWKNVMFTGFKQNVVLMGQLLGSRSDGEFFYSNVTLDEDFIQRAVDSKLFKDLDTLNMALREGYDLGAVTEKLKLAWVKLNEFLDPSCSCSRKASLRCEMHPKPEDEQA